MSYNVASIFDKSCDMTDWMSYPLYDLAKWNNGLAFRNTDSSTEGIPVVKIAELKNGITSQTQFTNTKYSENAKLEYGDMLFSWSGNPETSIDVFWFLMPSGWLNQHIFKVIPAEFMDKHYLFYILKYLKPQFTAIAKNKQTTGLGHVTMSDLKKIVVTIPDKSIQHTIAATLSCLDDKIELNNKINANLEAQAQAIFKSWFVDFEPFQNGEFVDSELGRIPKGWKVGCIGDVVRLQRGHDLPISTTIHGRYPVLGSKGVIGYHNEYTTEAPCIVMGRSGNIGNPRYYPYSCWAHNTTIYVKEYFCVPLWVFYILKQVDYSIFKGGSAVPTLNRNHVESYRIIIPPEVVQKNFNDLINPMIAVINRNIEENLALETLRDTLLPKLMSGEVVMD